MLPWLETLIIGIRILTGFGNKWLYNLLEKVRNMRLGLREHDEIKCNKDWESEALRSCCEGIIIRMSDYCVIFRGKANGKLGKMLEYIMWLYVL